MCVGTEAPCKTSGHEFGTVECKRFRDLGRLGKEQEWWEMQSRTDIVRSFLDVNAEWTEERDSGAPRGA